MNNQSKFWIRTVVLAAILAWPSVETYRLLVTQQKQAEAQALAQSVQVKVEAARAKHIQVVGSPDANAAPGTK